MFQHLRPFFISITLFLLINFFINSVVDHPEVQRPLSRWVANRLPEKIELLEKDSKKAHIDVLVLGSSLSEQAFATPVFENMAPYKVNAFNMGLPATRYDVLRTYLNYHIHNIGKPKLVILEVGEFMFAKKDLFIYMPILYFQNLIKLDQQTKAFIAQNISLTKEDKTELTLSGLSGLYKYRVIFSPLVIQRKLTDKIKPYFINKLTTQPLPDEVTEKGLIDKNEPEDWMPTDIGMLIQTDSGAELNAKKLKPLSLDILKERDFTKFTDILKDCKKQDIPVVLVQWPMHPAYMDLFKKTGYYKPFQEEINKTAMQYQLSYFDYNQTHIIESSRWFNDTRHLSKVGAVKITELFTKELFSKPDIQESFSK